MKNLSVDNIISGLVSKNIDFNTINIDKVHLGLKENSISINREKVQAKENIEDENCIEDNSSQGAKLSKENSTNVVNKKAKDLEDTNFYVKSKNRKD